MASFPDVCDKPLKGPEGPPRRCHPHTVGLTLMDLEMLRHFPGHPGTEGQKGVPLNTEPDSGSEKDGVGGGHYIPSWDTFCSGAPFPLASLKAQCAHPSHPLAPRPRPVYRGPISLLVLTFSGTRVLRHVFVPPALSSPMLWVSAA